jgi:hypothetical protein
MRFVMVQHVRDDCGMIAAHFPEEKEFRGGWGGVEMGNRSLNDVGKNYGDEVTTTSTVLDLSTAGPESEYGTYSRRLSG